MLKNLEASSKLGVAFYNGIQIFMLFKDQKLGGHFMLDIIHAL